MNNDHIFHFNEILRWPKRGLSKKYHSIPIPHIKRTCKNWKSIQENKSIRFVIRFAPLWNIKNFITHLQEIFWKSSKHQRAIIIRSRWPYFVTRIRKCSIVLNKKKTIWYHYKLHTTHALNEQRTLNAGASISTSLGPWLSKTHR